MEPDHQRFRFSATFRTDDAAVLHCLRALNHWANRGESQPMIGWGAPPKTTGNGKMASQPFASRVKHGADSGKTKPTSSWAGNGPWYERATAIPRHPKRAASALDQHALRTAPACRVNRTRERRMV